jgi:hypothetical protein
MRATALDAILSNGQQLMTTEEEGDMAMITLMLLGEARLLCHHTGVDMTLDPRREHGVCYRRYRLPYGLPRSGVATVNF